MGKAAKTKEGKVESRKRKADASWLVHTINGYTLDDYGITIERHDKNYHSDVAEAQRRAGKYINQIINQDYDRDGRTINPDGMDVTKVWHDGSEVVLYDLVNSKSGKVVTHLHVVEDDG